MIFVVFVVKPGHSRILLSNETEHVKVVDAMSYVPSPSHDECASPAIMSPANSEMFESPVDKHRAELVAPRRRVRRR